MFRPPFIFVACLCVSLVGCQNTFEPAAVAPSEAIATDRADTPFRIESFEVQLKRDRSQAPYTAEALALLGKDVSLKTDNLTLKALIDFVRAETDANINVNWSALELVGIDRDSLVSVDIQGKPAWKLLQLALNQVSADAFQDDKADFQTSDGIDAIATLHELKKNTTTRIYDVSWYVNKELSTMYQLYDKPKPKQQIEGDTDPNELLDEAGLPEARRQPMRPQAWLCSTYTSSEDIVFEYDANGEYILSRQTLIDQVVELIHMTVGDQDEWLDDQSTILELNNVLVVETTLKNHEDISALLNGLYRARVNHFERRARFREAVKLLKADETFRMEQDYRQALKHIDQALKVAPNYTEAHVLHKIVVGAMRD